MSSFGKSKGGGRRSAPRAPVPLTAVFTTVVRSDSALVVDVSTTGVRLRGRDLPVGTEAVEVTMEATRAFGSVMWSEDGECGIEFDEPLHPAEIAVLRQKVTILAGLPPQLKAALEDWTTGFAR